MTKASMNDRYRTNWKLLQKDKDFYVFEDEDLRREGLSENGVEHALIDILAFAIDVGGDRSGHQRAIFVIKASSCAA